MDEPITDYEQIEELQTENRVLKQENKKLAEGYKSLKEELLDDYDDLRAD